MMAPKRPPAPAHDAPDLGDVALITVLQALSDPVRLEMVRQLGRCPGAGELGCGQIEVPVSRSTKTWARTVSSRTRGCSTRCCARPTAAEARPRRQKGGAPDATGRPPPVWKR